MRNEECPLPLAFFETSRQGFGGGKPPWHCGHAQSRAIPRRSGGYRRGASPVEGCRCPLGEHGVPFFALAEPKNALEKSPNALKRPREALHGLRGPFRHIYPRGRKTASFWGTEQGEKYCRRGARSPAFYQNLPQMSKNVKMRPERVAKLRRGCILSKLAQNVKKC